MKRLAVIDLGTNTFHLLVVMDKGDGSYVEIYREREYVKLGEQGIHEIGRAAFKRGIEALEKFRGLLDLWEVVDYRAFGTAALREAGNADIFIRRAEQAANIKIEVIHGQREAELIFTGIRDSGALTTSPFLIMDIGGGSIEFILGLDKKLVWSTSLPIGAAVLYNKFGNTDPIDKKVESEIIHHLTSMTSELATQIHLLNPTTLIGSSGTFDVLADAFGKSNDETNYTEVSVELYREFTDKVKRLSHEERLDLDEVPSNRADLIVVALILIEFVMSLSNFDQIKVSPYSLKEGMLRKILDIRHPEVNI